MKLFFVSAFALTLATPAFAADKICFYSRGGNGGGSQGDHFQAKISNQKVVISQSTSDSYNGSYKRDGDDVQGRDGETYLDYDLGGEEGCSSILVDRKLLTRSGQGLVKFRCRGEGFGEDIFFCRNDRPRHEPAE